jgi:branched-chain amino acid aminotransferase
LIYFDGRLYEGPTVPFDLSDRGFLLGDALFETLPAFNGTAFRRADHIRRMLAGAETLGIPLDAARLDEAIDTLLPHAPQPAATLRLTLTRGPGPRGVRPPPEPRPSLIATCAPWNPALPFAPVRLALAPMRRNAQTPLARLKVPNYLDAVLALDEAVRRGCDDALFLDTAGCVACASAANVFAVRGRTLLTPPAVAVLPGIMRALVLELAGRHGYEARQAPLTLDDLRAADALFLTNSVRLLSPVISLEQTKFEAPPAAADALRGAILDLILAECGHKVGRPD